MARGWLIIERLENWEVDARNDFSFFGLSKRYRKTASEIAQDDLVFCYVSSGLSAFSDIRIVKEAGIKALKNQSYDSSFSDYFSTKSVLALPRKRWIPIKTIASQLELTRDRADYRGLFQTSIRKLSEHDASLLEERLRAAVE